MAAVFSFDKDHPSLYPTTKMNYYVLSDGLLQLIMILMTIKPGEALLNLLQETYLY